MKQVAFLIDLSWLQDEETTVAVRFACLQLLTTWPSTSCKFGYMLFNSENPRTQKINAVDFASPSTDAVSEFESQLIEGCAAPKSKPASVQLETIRWALSRSVTDFNWHSVTVTSPVKVSRKRKSTPAVHDENRNLLFIFSQLPQGTISRIRDDLLTSSLTKCLQENRIDLFWLHDSLVNGPTSPKCNFLRMRDLVQLCGVFPNDSLQISASLAPRSKLVARLLQSSKPQPLAACTLSMDSFFNHVDLCIFSTQSDTETSFDAPDSDLHFVKILDEPCFVSLLANASKIFFAVSRDPHFHRILIELRHLKMVGLICFENQNYILKSMADSVGALIKVSNSELRKFESVGEAPLRSFDSILLDERFVPDTLSTPVAPSVPSGLMTRLQDAYKNHEAKIETPKPRVSVVPVIPKKTEPLPLKFNSVDDLLQQMTSIYSKAMENKADLVSSAQSMVSAGFHYFQNDLPRTRKFFDDNFPLPTRDGSRAVMSNDFQLYVLLNFEVTALDHQSSSEDVKENIIIALRKLIFLMSPSEVSDFVRETLKNLYMTTARSLLEDLAEEFDLELFPSSDDELSSKDESFCEPLSGISSLGSQSNPRSNRVEVPLEPLRRVSSAQLSQRQIEMPKRKVAVHKSEQKISPEEESMRKPSLREIPTTPRGKRVLKTQVVPETPISKQAPGRVLRTQEMLRRRSSIFSQNESPDDPNEVEESPIRPKGTPRKSPKTTPRKNLTRRLRFSPQKKSFASPSAMSLLHLTTSPVLFKSSKDGRA